MRFSFIVAVLIALCVAGCSDKPKGEAGKPSPTAVSTNQSAHLKIEGGFGFKLGDVFDRANAFEVDSEKTDYRCYQVILTNRFRDFGGCMIMTTKDTSRIFCISAVALFDTKAGAQREFLILASLLKEKYGEHPTIDLGTDESVLEFSDNDKGVRLKLSPMKTGQFQVTVVYVDSATESQERRESLESEIRKSAKNPL